MSLAEQLEQAKRRDQIKAWDDGERKLGATIVAPEVELSADLRSRLGPFFEFAESKSVRRLPARPATVAAWIRFQASLVVPTEQILAALLAIEAAHDRHSLANPVRTAVVRAELNSIVKVDPPRSWPTAEKGMFALLAPDVRHIIALREQQRDNEIRRLQSKVARELELRREGEPNNKSASEDIGNNANNSIKEISL
jgi:hypothetical protein